jgi:hypothetical protein
MGHAGRDSARSKERWTGAPTRARSLGAVLVVLLACVGRPSAAAGARATPPRAQGEAVALDEGPLDNASFLAVNDAANLAMARADALQVELSAAAFSPANERRWNELFDQWHVVLRDAEEGAAIAPTPDGAGAKLWPDFDGTADPAADRRRDGLEAALLRRFLSAPAQARALWTGSQERLAAEQLSLGARDPQAMVRVERRFFATPSAARAALALADVEFERARPRAAQAWLVRAEQHLRLAGAPTDLFAAALDQRRAAFAADTTAAPAIAASWSKATRLEPAHLFPLEDLRRRQPARGRLEPGLSIRPGLAFFGDRYVLAHFSAGDGPQSLALYDLEAGVQVGRTDVTALLRDGGFAVGGLLDSPDIPGWPLAVSAQGGAAVFVVGRRGTTRGNALVCLDIAVDPDPKAPPQVALRWVWHDGRRVLGPDAPDASAPSEWTTCEFQPGVALAGENVVFAVREYETAEEGGDFQARAAAAAAVRTSLAAVDLASGQLVWKRWLGRGVEVQRSTGRFFGARAPAASASPLGVDEANVLLHSNTGFSALLSTLDGRLHWSLRTRRRAADERVWSGAAPTAVAFPGGISAWASAPADSDHLYWLRNAPDLDGRGLFCAAPHRAPEGTTLLGARGSEAFVLSPHGPERALSSWEALRGRTRIAPYLGPDEQLTGDGLCSPQRALFATQFGLYLIDLERELYLIGQAPLESPRGLSTVGGSVHAHGGWACVIGPSALWVFRAQ